MTFIQANGKITSAATDSTGAKLVKTDCPICGLENAKYTRLPLGDDGNESERYCGIYAQKYPDGRLYIYGECCDESAHYYPKYCPECGRKLYD